MKMFFFSLMLSLVLFAAVASAQSVEYTNRKNTDFACELFARDAYHAAQQLQNGNDLTMVLNAIEYAPVSPGAKHRAFEAIQLVWKNQLHNPVLASTIAMGLCVSPRQTMAPLDDVWAVSPRTIKDIL